MKGASIDNGSLASPASPANETTVENEGSAPKPDATLPSNNISGEIVDIELSPVVIPTVIAGASLTCRPETGYAQCETRANDYSLIDIPDAKFYLIAEDLVWTPVEYQRTAVGTVTIQTNLEIYAIGLSTPDGSVTGTWVNPPPLNILKNGSFEDLNLASLPGPYFPSVTDPWQAVMSDGSNCEKAYLDVFTTAVAITAPNGSKYIDLNAVCIAGTQDYSDHIVSQNIPTVRGQIYQIYYVFTANRNAAQMQGLFSYWNLDIKDRLELGVTNGTAWIQRSYLGVAVTNESRVGFRDPQKTPDGHGGLLDNVRVYGLGTGPVK